MNTLEALDVTAGEIIASPLTQTVATIAVAAWGLNFAYRKIFNKS